MKVLGKPGLKSHDARRRQSGPSLGVSIEALHAIFDYLAAAEISMYRLSSDFVPYSTHLDLPQFHGQIERHARELEGLAARAREPDLRLSLHPSQYVVLNAVDPEVMRKSIADLDVQPSSSTLWSKGRRAWWCSTSAASTATGAPPLIVSARAYPSSRSPPGTAW